MMSITLADTIAHLREHDSTGDEDFIAELIESMEEYPDWTISDVPIDEISTWCSDEETARYYAEQNLDEFPEIILVPLNPPEGKKIWTALDGAHRAWAFELAGRKTIPAYHPDLSVSNPSSSDDRGKTAATNPEFVYHMTPTSRTKLIQHEGIKTEMSGKWAANMREGRWSDQYYSVRPIYVVVDPSRMPIYLEGDLFEVDAEGLELVCDIPSLTEYGPRFNADRGTFYWGWDPNRPLSEASLEIGDLANLLNEEGEIEIDELITPGSPAAEAAIKVTGTACVLEDIPADRVRLVEA